MKPKRPYTRWDLLIGYDRLGAPFAMTARTSLFDEWLANPDRERPGSLANLNAEYWRRRAHWEARLAVPPEHDDPTGRWWPAIVALGSIVLMSVGGHWILAGAALLLYIGAIPALTVLMTRRSRTLARSLRDARCPDCWYDLSGTTALRPELLDGAFLGPARCPECGAPWPLVPPAVGAPGAETGMLADNEAVRPVGSNPGAG